MNVIFKKIIVVITLSISCGAMIQAKKKPAQQQPIPMKTAPAVMSWEDICKNYKDAVVKIIAYKHECNIIEPYKAPNQGMGTGTGFFISCDGHLLTNFHVVSDAAAACIEIPSLGKERFEIVPVKLYPGDDVAHMKLTDDALNRVKELLEVDELTSCTLGNSDQLAEAQEIMTLGYPLGFERKVSTGIVSGRESLDRELIQTTAPINPGNSGGPFFNKSGEVVGICVSGIRNADGIGYLIPINNVLVLQKETSENLIVSNPYWGISCIASSVDILHYCGVPYTDRGIRIIDVKKGSLSAEYGLQVGDFILSVNDIKVDRFGYLNVSWAKEKISISDFLSRSELASIVVFSIFRDGALVDLSCEVKSTQPFKIKRYFPWYDESLSYEVIAGMVFVQLTLNHVELYKEMSKHYNSEPSSFITQYGEPDNRLEPRVMMTKFFQTSKLHKTNCFRDDDRIVKKVNGEVVTTIEELREAIKMGIGEKYLTVECEGGSFAAFSIKDIIEEENILPVRYGYERSDLVDYLASGL